MFPPARTSVVCDHWAKGGLGIHVLLNLIILMCLALSLLATVKSLFDSFFDIYFEIHFHGADQWSLCQSRWITDHSPTFSLVTETPFGLCRKVIDKLLSRQSFRTNCLYFWHFPDLSITRSLSYSIIHSTIGAIRSCTVSNCFGFYPWPQRRKPILRISSPNSGFSHPPVLLSSSLLLRWPFCAK